MERDRRAIGIQQKRVALIGTVTWSNQQTLVAWSHMMLDETASADARHDHDEPGGAGAGAR